MKPNILLLVGASLFRVCGERTPPSPTVAATTTAPALQPEHGGVVAISAGLSTEVAMLPDGRLAAYLRDAQQRPLTAHQVALQVQRSDGQSVPVAMTYDPALRAYVGRPTGFAPGNYPVELSVQLRPDAPVVELDTPAVNMTALGGAPSGPTLAAAPGIPVDPGDPGDPGDPAMQAAHAAPAPAMGPLPRARHGGRVQRVGNYAVELVSRPQSGVQMYFMDQSGRPVPPSMVNLPSVTVNSGDEPETVVPRIEGDHFVAPATVAAGGNVAVVLPSVVIGGVAYAGVEFEPVPVLVVAAPIIAAPVVTAPFVVFHGHGRGHGHGHGHGRGHWGRGGFVIVH
jgi:hypothetical protein